jgi:hypothetical protein
MASLLKEVIEIGGRALEAEDLELRKIYQRRGQYGGLLQTDFERYFQFVVWRSLVSKYDAQIECSHEGLLVDLVITQDTVTNIFEMKNWREETTTRISSDIRRLQNFRGGGYLLIFSANPKELTDENLLLVEQLPGIAGQTCKYMFQTESPIHHDKPYEFWFAGWQIIANPQNMVPSGPSLPEPTRKVQP